MPRNSRGLRYGQVTIRDGGSNSLVLAAMEGGLNWMERSAKDVIRIRDVNDHVRLSPDVQPIALTFSLIYESLSVGASVTPYDALTQTGAASGWASVGESHEPYMVEIEFKTTDTAGANAEYSIFNAYVLGDDSIGFEEGAPYSVLRVAMEGSYSGKHYVYKYGAAWYTSLDLTLMYQELAKSNLVSSDGQRVAAVECSLGTGPDLLAPADANAAYYRSSGFNSHATIQGDITASARMFTTALGLAAPYGIIASSMFPDAAQSALLSATTANNNSTHMAAIFDGTTDGFTATMGQTAGTFATVNEPTTIQNDPGLLSLVRPSSSPITLTGYDLDTSDENEDTATVNPERDFDNVQVFARRYNTTANDSYSNAHLVDLFIYSGVIPSDELSQIITFFKGRAA